MTRHIFVIQVLDPDDATLGIVPQLLESPAMRNAPA